MLIDLSTQILAAQKTGGDIDCAVRLSYIVRLNKMWMLYLTEGGKITAEFILQVRSQSGGRGQNLQGQIDPNRPKPCPIGLTRRARTYLTANLILADVFHFRLLIGISAR